MSDRTITRAAHLDHLADLRQFVVDACVAAGLDSATCFAFKLVADEACVNIIEHAYRDRPPGHITLRFTHTADHAALVIQDDGHPFDPRTAPEPDITADWDERRPGGLGVFFMRELMTGIDYTYHPAHGNTLTLTRRLAPANHP